MHFTPILAIISIAASGALAAPGRGGGGRPHPPPKPSKPHNPQYNFCGNGVTPYCCNNEASYGGNVDCSALDQSGICDTTIVCCNADDSAQNCVGNINTQIGWGWGFF